MWLLSTPVFKVLAVFSMFFVATRDIRVAGILAFAYLVLFMGLLHEKSKISVIPIDVRYKIEAMTDKPTEQQYIAAKQIVTSFEAHVKK
jgi:hypothetical protein